MLNIEEIISSNNGSLASVGIPVSENGMTKFDGNDIHDGETSRKNRQYCRDFPWFSVS